MIFFKFNLLSFTITILAVSITPGYSSEFDDPKFYNDICTYVLRYYTGFVDNVAQDSYNIHNKTYQTTINNAPQNVKNNVKIKILAIYTTALQIVPETEFTTEMLKNITKNLIEGYTFSVLKRKLPG
uniref:Uncharacterized protein n=1 Tax=Schizaphis graminum TaxID=13262 RepID=A0A2S2NCP1_SCHGA